MMGLTYFLKRFTDFTIMETEYLQIFEMPKITDFRIPLNKKHVEW
jgi:hypothetical protein